MTYFVILLFPCFIFSQSVRIGMNEWFGYAPNIIADQKGFWKDLGLDVSVVVYNDGNAAIDGFNRGDVDILHDLVSSVSAVYARQKSYSELHLLAVTNWSYGGDKILLRKGVSLNDNLGDSIGVFADIDDVRLFLDLFLKTYNRKLSSFYLEEVMPQELNKRFANGKYTLVVQFDPYAFSLVEKGHAKLVTTSRFFKGVFPEGWIVRSSFLKQLAPKTLIQLYLGSTKAVDWINDSKNFKEMIQLLNTYFFSKSYNYIQYKRMKNGLYFLTGNAFKDANAIHIYRYLEGINAIRAERNVPLFSPKLIQAPILLKQLEEHGF